MGSETTDQVGRLDSDPSSNVAIDVGLSFSNCCGRNMEPTYNN